MEHLIIPATILMKRAAPDTPRQPRSNRNTALYNSFSPRQLDDMVYDWLRTGRLVPYYSSPTCGGNKVYQCTFVPSGPTDKYAQAYLKKEWREKWREDGNFVPTAQKVLVHVIYWRWANQYKPLTEGTEISHCWKDHNDVLYLCQESLEMNESRKYCMKFDWWHPKNRRHARCNHHPPCWGDVNK